MKTTTKPGPQAKEIVIPGIGTFRSIGEACKHQGVSYSVLMRRLETDYYTPLGTFNRERLAQGLPTRSQHYDVGNFASFATIHHAAEALDISPQLLRTRITAGIYGSEIKADSQTIRTMWKPPRQSI